jgi:undecaprenyl-diphosphatase
MGIDVAIILGLIQGVTEFVPVSSTGHLILGRKLFATGGDTALAFDAVLQMATALAILVYFLPDIQDLFMGKKRKIAHTNIQISWRSVGVIAIATVPGVIAGVLLEPYMSTVFRSPKVVAGALIAGSLLILAAEHVPNYHQEKSLTFKTGFIVGLFQCLALIPGMSRSGSTISGGLLVGLTRSTATSFSFLLGMPILFGAGGKKLLELVGSSAFGEIWLPLVVGCIVAFVSGLAAMHVLMRFVRSNRLDWFAWYRIALAVAVIFII